MTIQEDIAARTTAVDNMTAAVVEGAATRQQAVSDAQGPADAAAGTVGAALSERPVAPEELATGGQYAWAGSHHQCAQRIRSRSRSRRGQ